MDNKTLAQAILKNVGGAENVKSAQHCATRLRIITKNQDLVNVNEIESLDKVKGSFYNSGQYQIILGTGLVDKVYEEFMPLLGQSATLAIEEQPETEKLTFKRAIRIFGDVFVPIIPVLVATGLFMGLRGLLTQEAVLNVFGLTPTDVPTQLIQFTQILTDTAFAFLPALVAWSTFNIFGGTPILGMVLGLMLVSTILPNAYTVASGDAKPLVFFGFLKVVGYQGSVLPAFMTAIVTSKIEKWFKKVIPDSLDLILRPFLTLLVGLILGLFIIGPIFHEVEVYVLAIVEYILTLPFGIGGIIYGSFGQLLGILGIHHILNLLEINMLAKDGWNMLNPIGTCGNIAQAGAVLAVAIKTVSNKMKQIAYPSALSASLGITEPAVFGVTLRLGKPFIMSMIGGGVGGFFASIFHLKATGLGLTGIPGTLLYLNSQLPLYILVNLIAFATAFTLTWMFGYKKEETLAAPSGATNNGTVSVESVAKGVKTQVVSAAAGNVMPISAVNDPVFSGKMMGDGFAVSPTIGRVVAPVSGKVKILFPTKHAIGLETKEGMEVLVHMGIDTVSLDGKPFKIAVSEGESVSAGQEIAQVDLQALKDAGKEDTIIVAFTNADQVTFRLDKQGNQKAATVIGQAQS